MSFPHFMHLPTSSGSGIDRSVYIDNMTYDHFLLTDLARCAAILRMSSDLDNVTEFFSTDDIFEQYLKFAKSNSILDYFLINFERILTMYVHARFGNLLTVIVERVKEPLVKFPIGCFVDHSNLIIIYSPEKLCKFVDRLSMSIFLYASENGFIRNRENDSVFNSRGMREHEERLKKFLNIEQKNSGPHYSKSFNDTLPTEYKDFFSGINSFASNNKSHFTCDRYTPLLSTDVQGNFDMIAYSSSRQCEKVTEEDSLYSGCDLDGEDAVFLTTNYLASKKMMLEFNKVFEENNKSVLLYLSAIRTILSTAVRPVVDLFIVKSDEKIKEHRDNQRKKVNRLACAAAAPSIIKSGRFVPQQTTIVEQCKNRRVEMIDSSLRQQRLNIDVCVRQ